MTWYAMVARCHNPCDPRWKGYGSRGISVCERWRESYPNFLADMGEKPAGVSLDRIDNDGNYEPGNCRWATAWEQARNRRNNKWVVLDGQRMTHSEAARHLGITPAAITYRLRAGIDIAAPVRYWPSKMGLLCP